MSWEVGPKVACSRNRAAAVAEASGALGGETLPVAPSVWESPPALPPAEAHPAAQRTKIARASETVRRVRDASALSSLPTRLRANSCGPKAAQWPIPVRPDRLEPARRKCYCHEC